MLGKRRPALLLFGVFVLAACGASAVTKAPRVASLTACNSTRDAAVSASNVAFATTGSYPKTFTALTSGKPPLLIAGDKTTVTPSAIVGAGWKLSITGGGTTPPTFVCANTPVGSSQAAHAGQGTRLTGGVSSKQIPRDEADSRPSRAPPALRKVTPDSRSARTGTTFSHPPLS